MASGMQAAVHARSDPPPAWLVSLRTDVLDAVSHFLDTTCAQALRGSHVDITGRVLRDMLAEGKCLRSTYLYLGWRAGADGSRAAVRAAGSLEFLHAFALFQDDVMDESSMRRGRPSAHRAFEDWHRERGLPGSSARFGESAAVLLGDLCLVWAEQMLRESGLPAESLARAWPHYDAMRTELAVGQFADLVNDTAGFPTLDRVLDVARRKSGNYTVRRPLEIGAALAGCDDAVAEALSRYGENIGEAFQLRDDLLGVFGAPATTGKPTGTDLVARKATTVVVAAYELATGAQQRQFKEFMTADGLGDEDITRWQNLISEVGTVQRIEDLIHSRFAAATAALDDVAGGALDPEVRAALVAAAAACTERTA
ncbi:polyprenyl synthetase family protein [Mycolicibacterium sp. 22603]|uniref:polyprenyl synthetase family protein n=1 Tax=Mycolicibacterium sp. 22603 TaxID=3453950 RepID=UPI003F86EDC2